MGEFQPRKERNKIVRDPEGRGMLECSDKWILGYVVDGIWDIQSPRVVIEKHRTEFRVYRYFKARDGTLLDYCSTFN